MAYFSPAAADGNDPNKSGCLGYGDSLRFDLSVEQ